MHRRPDKTHLELGSLEHSKSISFSVFEGVGSQRFSLYSSRITRNVTQFYLSKSLGCYANDVSRVNQTPRLTQQVEVQVYVVRVNRVKI